MKDGRPLWIGELAGGQLIERNAQAPYVRAHVVAVRVGTRRVDPFRLHRWQKQQNELLKIKHHY